MASEFNDLLKEKPRVYCDSKEVILNGHETSRMNYESKARTK